jgi:hypothetical protein
MCAGSISFVNAAGTTIGTASSFTVTSGSTAPRSLAISLETFDTSTGVTHTFVPLDASFSAGPKID